MMSSNLGRPRFYFDDRCDRTGSCHMRHLAAALLVMLAWASQSTAADEPDHVRRADVIYGRKFGTALTMDVFTPKQEVNGAAVVFTVSGGWFSDHRAIRVGFFAEFLKRGYTAFAV